MTDLLTIAAAAKAAARRLAVLSTADKNAALEAMAAELLARQEAILAANREDLEAARQGGMAPAMLDRLALSPARLAGIADAIRALIALPDPIGETYEMQTRPNGLQVGKRRVPLGVVGVIYESRPNVTVDVAAICLKTGSACVLRGGSESLRSNVALVEAMLAALRATGVPEGAIGFVDSPDRAVVGQMLRLNGYIDVVIPRGGAGLIKFVVENATLPVIETGAGVCHTYVDRSADLAKAVAHRLQRQGPPLHHLQCAGHPPGAHGHRAPVPAGAGRRMDQGRRGDALRPLFPGHSQGSRRAGRRGRLGQGVPGPGGGREGGGQPR